MSTFKATLRGSHEVPPVKTNATGNAEFHYHKDRQQLKFELILRNISRVTRADIHLGRKGENGPVVAVLFGPSKFGITVKRGVVSGVLRACDLVGPLRGRTIYDLVCQLREGNAYVNVHTVRHPNGAIRGQIRRCK
ncbi:CHRD domain-containing protein [Paenibacillus sp. 8b26]|uniref:CHRD domain-containing protein n=1 Tax=Paenibacillus sp. 8b26 TaxID=3424133 RepID=UPI003D65E794